MAQPQQDSTATEESRVEQPRESREPREMQRREPKDAQEVRERQPREARESRPSRERREAKDGRNPGEGQQTREPRRQRNQQGSFDKRNRVDHAMSVNQRKIGRDGKFVSLVNLRSSVRPSQLLKPKELRVKRINHLQLHNKTVPEFSGTVLFVKKSRIRLFYRF